MDPLATLTARRWICAFRANDKHLLHVTIESPTSAWRHHWPCDARTRGDILGIQIQKRVDMQLRVQLTRSGLHTIDPLFRLESIQPATMPTDYRIWVNASPYTMQDVKRVVRAALLRDGWITPPPPPIALEFHELIASSRPVSPVARIWYTRHRGRDVAWAIRSNLPPEFYPYSEAFGQDALWVVDQWVHAWITE